MALEFQHVPLQLGGANTKTDERNLLTGEFVTAQNVVMQKSGALRARDGYVRVGTDTFSSAIGMAEIADGVVVLDDSGALKYPSATSTVSTISSQLPVGRYSVGATTDAGIGAIEVSFATNAAGWVVTGKRDVNSNLLIINLFNPDGVIVRSITTSSSSDWQVCIQQNNGIAYAVYRTSNWVLSKLTESGTSSISSPLSGVSSTASVDVFAFDDYLRIIWSVAATGLVASARMNTSTETFGSTVTHDTFGALARNPPIYVGPASEENAFCVAWANVTNTTKGIVYYDDAGTDTPRNSSSRTLTVPPLRVSMAEVNSIRVILATEISGYFGGVALVANQSYSVSVSAVEGLFNSTVRVHGTRLGQKAFTIDGQPIIPMATSPWTINPSSPTPPVPLDYLFSDATEVFYRFNFSGITFTLVPWLNSTRGGAYVFPLGSGVNNKKPYSYISSTTGLIGAASVEVADLLGTANKIRIGFLSADYGGLPSIVSTGDQAYTTAFGNLATMGFISGEEIPLQAQFPSAVSTVVITGTTGGNLGTGTYRYRLVYELLDNRGNVTTSLFRDVLHTFASGTTNRVVLNVLTPEYYFNSGAKISVYRTQANGTVFYLINAITSGANGTLTDDSADTGIISGRQFPYGETGLLEPSSIPIAGPCALARNRLWFASAESSSVWYSKQFVAGEAPQFSEALTVPVSERGGVVTAIAEMDEKVIIFKENAIFATYGDGPDETGTPPFPVPQLISQSVGCRDERSVVLTDAGLLFMSSEGIYLLSRGLDVAYIGAPVEAFNGYTVSGALNKTDEHRIYMFTQEGVTLIWDEFHKMWTWATGQPTNAALTNGAVKFIRSSDGYLLQEQNGAVTDAGTAIPLTLETGWISLAGIQGFQRFRKLTWNGVAQDDMTVTLWNDWEAVASETIPVDVSLVGSPLQWQVKPARQKCQAMKYRLSIPAITGDVTISGFGIEAGLKNGSNKVATNKRVGG